MDLSERGSSAAHGATRHPWEIARYRAFRSILADHGCLSRRRVLDVGSGDGWFARQLLIDMPNIDQIVCWDIHYDDHELATDDARLVRTAAAPTPPDQAFDLVLLLDVIEHIADPPTFIHDELRPLVAPGTPVLVGVPAHQPLFSDHDRALDHFRRYSPAQLRAETEGWLDITDHGSLFTSLLAPRVAAVAVERVRGPRPVREHGVGTWSGGALLSRAIAGALHTETKVHRRSERSGWRFPGLSTWVFGSAR